MISLVITVLNERDSLPEWLESILGQSKLPDEIVIADGGSTDGTWEWLQKNIPLGSLRIIQTPGNIASGRNAAIRESKGNIIVVTDAGCSYDWEWLKKITDPIIAGDAKFVTTAFGPWLKSTDSLLTYAVAASTTPARRELLTKNWLPSSRSVAFTTELWHTAGGYPEWIPYCEDVIFDRNLLKKGINFYYIREPLVFWRPRNSLKAYFKQLYNYTRSEGHALLNTNRQFIRYAVYLVALAMLIFGAFGSYNLIALLWIGMLVYMHKFDMRFGEFAGSKSYGFKFAGLFLIIAVVAIGDIAKMCGWPVGLYQRITGKIGPK